MSARRHNGVLFLFQPPRPVKVPTIVLCVTTISCLERRWDSELCHFCYCDYVFLWSDGLIKAANGLIYHKEQRGVTMHVFLLLPVQKCELSSKSATVHSFMLIVSLQNTAVRFMRKRKNCIWDSFMVYIFLQIGTELLTHLFHLPSFISRQKLRHI